MDISDTQKVRQVFIKPTPEMRLHRDQIRVINVLRGQSKCDSLDAEGKLITRLHTLSITLPLENILSYLAENAPLVIHISPANIQKLLEDTHYRSTFETNTKGDGYLQSRITWESECFHKLYDGVKSYERPKYGALNYLNCPAGVRAARSYGEWFFELKNTVRKRITLATGDTASSRVLGVLDFCAHVVSHLDDTELRLLTRVVGNDTPFEEYSHHSPYREIQIHGEIKLDTDIASLNVPKKNINDPAAQQFSMQFGVPIVGF